MLGTIVLLSLMVERFLSPLFEWRPVLNKIKEKGLKEPVAILVSFLVVYIYQFDALAIIFKDEANTTVAGLFRHLELENMDATLVITS